jgi:phosphoglycolate phosphatase
MNNDAIIFDIDGTLWNACKATAKGLTMGLTKLGIDKEITTSQVQEVAGNSFEKCMEILLPGLTAKYPTLINTLHEYEIKNLKSEGGIFYDDVIEGIKRLAASHKIFIVSNCKEPYMELFLNFSKFKPILTGFDCNGMSGLPKNEMLTKMKKDYSLNNPVYIGDTDLDETSAKLANMDFIYAAYGFGKAVNNPLSFNSFTSLLEYLETR